MPLRYYLLLSSALSLGVALPVSERQTSAVKAFSISQVYNPHFSTNNGVAAHKKALAKYTSPSSYVDSSSTTASNSPLGNTYVGTSGAATPGAAQANAIDYTDLEYLTPVTVGGKTYMLDFDTGSSDLWIGGQNTGARNKYTPTIAPVSSQSWSITYGDESNASGDVYSETVAVGGTTATAVAVGRATNAPNSFFALGANGQPGSDGLLGLGFSSSNTFQPQQKTWFDTAVSQGLPPIFAANLMFGTAAGSYDFGGFNPSSYTGDIVFLDVVAGQNPLSKYWMVAPAVGDVGVMDTGTTLMLLSSTTNQAYYSTPAALAAGAQWVTPSDGSGGFWAYHCNSTLPNFTVTLSDMEAVVPGGYLNYQTLSNGLC